MTPPGRTARSRPLVLWAPVAAFLLLSFALSSIPGDDLQLPISDILGHFAEFLVLGILLIRAFHGGMTGPPTLRTLVLAAVAAILWALADEFHQSFVPGRVASAGDLLSDAGGAVAAWGVFPALQRLIAAGRAEDPRRRSGAKARLIFLTRDGCRLCHEAWDVLERVAPEFGLQVERLDVDSREELAREYGDDVPVLLVDGRKAFKHHIPEDRLRRRLRRL